jgi:tRNA A-37 threonylcarbamoyl transferase component Bud32
MSELKNICSDLMIPPYFNITESHNEWRIIHHDYESSVNWLFDGKIDNTQLGKTVKGRGEYITAHIKSLVGDDEDVILKTYKRGGISASFLPDIFNDPRRPLNELGLTEKARKDGVLVPEILGIQIKWITAFLFRAKIIYKIIPDTITLEDYIIFLLKNYMDKRHELYQRKRNLIKSLSQIISELHEIGIYHNDLNIRNILIRYTEKEIIQPYIIDLDKAIYMHPLSFNKRADNLIRLNRSLEKMIDRSDMLGIKNIITHADRFLLLKMYSNEAFVKGAKRYIIRKCQKHTELHKWWWKLYGAK